ncbi:CD48 antigen-like isoform X2 [Polyodon spathula]|uniref:CD48 antigen-like isoform X2 n=1 Tax=Polyodon spathula TaxID=7913 RepID=UPI001B7E52C3|nr:CD48 antigen-like isoform X2 [Polyodon spathula]
MSSMRDLVLILLLCCLTSGSESNPVDRYGLYGESLRLDVEEYDNLTFKRFLWLYADKKRLVEYTHASDLAENYKQEKFEFDQKNFSLLIKNLVNTDSGLYEAETVDYDGNMIRVITYNLTVQAAVSKPSINLTETPLANETCSISLNCSVKDGDDVFIHWEETGIKDTKSISNGSLLEYTPAPSAGDKESFTCYVENRVSKNSTTIMKNKLTCNRPMEDLVNTTYATVGENYESITSDYDVVNPGRMIQPIEDTTIYSAVQKQA